MSIWKWLWNTETKYYDEEITRDTDWGGDASTEYVPVSGGRIQEWLKNEINGKYGVIRISSTINEQNFYSLEMFATKEDEELYDNDPETYADRITIVPIPISTVQGDSFTAFLTTSMPSNDIVVVDDSLKVSFNYRSVRYTQGQASNEGALGTLTIQRSTDGGSTFSTVGTIPNVLQSREPTDTTTLQEVDLGGYLTQGKQLLRVRASYQYEDPNSGSERTMNSSWVTVGASVTKTSLRIDLVTEYYQPMSALDVNGNPNPFAVTYAVYGSVAKTLYMKVTGSTGAVSTTTYALDASVDSQNRTFSLTENATYGFMTHGVKKVEAWLECSDGLGNTLVSEKRINRFMVVNSATSGADLTKPYILLQNVMTEVDNFVQSDIAEYAVYSPSGENINVAFLLTAYTEDYETTKPEEYFRMETIVEPLKANVLKTTIEIEAGNEASELTKYDTYFRVRRITDTTDTDFMQESTGEKNYYIVVDNTDSLTPVKGATFLLNPKTRNNNEDNPAVIYNARNNNAVVDSEFINFGFINDGWMTADDGQKVLRIMAGSQLVIKRNFWAQFLTKKASSMTIEIDCKVSNVTNTTDPIIQMFEGTADSFKGLKMNALEGWLMNASNTNKDDCLFAWQEDKRTHFSINLHHQVKPNLGDVKYTSDKEALANSTFALARVIMNGDCVREMKYEIGTDAAEWCTTSDGSIIIGNEGADIDIYSIRIYEDKIVEMKDILNKNYLASLPTAEEKMKVFRRNDLLDGGLINLEKCKIAGLNCMILHGVLPYHSNPAEHTGWVELWRYDQDGNYLPEYSGTICQQTKSLKGKGQGSTAKTYYDWNFQEDSSKVKATILVALADFHASIIVGAPYTGEDGLQYVDIYGGHLGKNAPIEIPENAKPYPYANGKVTVPDGWIDGNQKYRGMGYMVAEGTSLAQKRVIKINYASSMQNHLLGACKTYDLLHRKVVGDTPLQKVIPTAVSAKHQEPFMFFNQEEGGQMYFKGMGTYGAGKADKVTWGFVKNEMPMYALIEGSDNNLPMTGFRVPFDKNTAIYDVDGEGWVYNGQQSFDFDLGCTFEPTSATEADGWQYVLKADDNEAPTAAIRDRWADIHNFIYLHSTNIKYYNGTFDSFKKSSYATDDTNSKYWCTQGNEAFILKRYDFINKEWIDAGLLNGSAYKVVDLRTDSVTTTAYSDWSSGGSGDYSILNTAFIAANVAHMKKYLKYFINEKSLQFNYDFVLGFLAGTDNSDKNTYYKIMPYAEEVETDADFTSWFSENFGKSFDYTAVHQLYFDGDDMDSIFRTNNNSHQTKPYYIDRMHPYADEDANTCLYEGMGNQLFNFVEKAYEGTNELSNMMNQILIAATELMSNDDYLYGMSDGKVSLWGFLHKYFFNIQHYFPQIAYMEQARIRYEFPELIGFISSGGGARSIRPITQSLGSQLENELQYMNQRVIYMTSYAGFGAWGGDTLHSIGLPDANETFNFTPAAMPDGSGATYTFTITPHQYIYPSYYNGQTFTSTHQRTSPNSTCTFTIAENVTTSDSGMGICGINYYSDLGNLGDKSIASDFNLNGKRINRFRVSAQSPRRFRPSTLIIGARNITYVYAVINSSTSPLSIVDFSNCIRLNSFSVDGYCSELILPETDTLEFASVNCTLRSFSIQNVKNLSDFRYGNTSIRTTENITIGSNVGTNIEGFTIQPIVESIYSVQKSQDNPPLKEISVQNVNWTDFSAEALEWFIDNATERCEFKGIISIAETSTVGAPAINFALKNKINLKFGNVDTGASGLKLNYLQRELTGAVMKGNVYATEESEVPLSETFGITPDSSYMNSFTGIRYSVSGNTKSECSINSRTGILTVTSLSDTEDTATITAVISTYYNGVSGSLTYSKTVDLWARPAQLGDLVYYDGTYGDASQWEEGDKTPIGVCFYVPPRNADGSINETFNIAKDKQLRLMVSLKNATASGTTGTFSSWQWGPFPMAGDEANQDEYSLYDTSADDTRVSLTCTSLKSIYNVDDVADITDRGEPASELVYLDISVDANSAYRDVNTPNGVINDGFKCFEPNVALGDGFAYLEKGNHLNITTARTLSAELAALTDGLYGEGDIVNMGYVKTLKIIAHRNQVLSENIIGADNEVLITAGFFPIPTDSDGLTELQSLARNIENIRTWVGQPVENGGLGETNTAKWSQLHFPAASACYAYEPTVEAGEVLADRFKKHHWWMPTEAQIARICWYYKFGALAETEGRGSNIFRGAMDKNLIAFSNSVHWSSTEFGSNYSWYITFREGQVVNYRKAASYVGRPISSF